MRQKVYPGHHRQSVKRRYGEQGLSLVEVALGLLLLSLVGMAAGELLRATIAPVLLQERQKTADTQLTGLLNDLAARSRAALPTGGSFVTQEDGSPVLDGEKVTLECSATYCDQIVALPEGRDQYRLVRWDYAAPLPDGARQVYLRAWAVRELDERRHLRRLTALIFPTRENIFLARRVLDAVQQ
jgi:hypothetical protein